MPPRLRHVVIVHAGLPSEKHTCCARASCTFEGFRNLVIEYGRSDVGISVRFHD